MPVSAKKTFSYISAIVIAFLMFSSLSSVLVSAATPKEDICKGLGLTGADCNDPASSAAASKSVNDTVASGIAILSYVIGVIAVIMIMIGGLKYITSNGDSGSISSAKNTILYAVIGLVVAMFAQLIVRFVINRV